MYTDDQNEANTLIQRGWSAEDTIAFEQIETPLVF